MIPSRSGICLDETKIRIEQRVHEHDQDGTVHVRFSQPDRVGRAQLLLLRHGLERQVRVLIREPGFDGRGQMPRDPDDLIDADLLELTEHVVEHGAVRDPQ